MRFAIVNGLPYLVSNGKMIPVEIKDGTVKIDKENARATSLKGRYTLIEIVAKCGNTSSIKKVTRKAE